MTAFAPRLKPVARARNTPSRRAAFWQSAGPSLLNAVLVLLVGYLLTGRVEQALKERAATVSSLQAMNDLITLIVNERVEAKRQINVRRLSMYGVDAIGPLITLSLSTDLPIQLPGEGLTLIAIQHPEAVCGALERAAKMGERFPDAGNQVRYLQKLSDDFKCGQRTIPWWNS
jgi:hypothetical protein